VINTKSTTVVTDIIEELCNVIGVDSANEREEFSLYCIVEGETFTVPLAKDHYILDVTTGKPLRLHVRFKSAFLLQTFLRRVENI
jgi:hypothetical protein